MAPADRLEHLCCLRYYDRDNSGELDFDEFRKAARKDAKLTKNEVSDVQLQKLFNRVDTDGGGTIGLDEFVQLLEGTEEYPTYTARAAAPAPAPALAPVEADQTGKVQPQREPLSPSRVRFMAFLVCHVAAISRAISQSKF